MKIIFFPLEIFNRDFHCKCLLAYKLAKVGYHVYIGRKAEIHNKIKYFKNCIYFGVVTVENYCDFYKDLKRLNHFVVILDEEGLVTFQNKMYLDFKVSRNTIKYIDLLLTWGEENKKILQDSKLSKQLRGKIFVTGNPRIDLLKKKYNNIFLKEISHIKKKYGRFVLYNSSFSFLDHFTKGIDYSLELKKQKVIKTNNDEKKFFIYRNILKSSKEIFIDSLELLATTYPNLNFVIRPHPSENHETYKNLSKLHRNVFLDYSYSIQPWLISCEALINSYCTTACEASVIGKKNFTIISKYDDRVHKYLPFIFNEASFSAAALKRNFDFFFQNKKINKNNYSFFVKNFDQNEDSFKNILNILDKIPCKLQSEEINKKFQIKNKLLKMLKNIFQFIKLNNFKKRNYINHKIGKIDSKIIINLIKVFEKNYYHYVSINNINKYLVKIEKK
jgi:surface carbohydrate biosynthesis protein